MSRFPEIAALAVLVALAAPAVAQQGPLGLGAPATEAEIAGWDIDVRPDGEGLPEGRGTVAQGEEVYIAQCAACHGDFGEGIDRWPVLSGGQGTLAEEDPVKTIGSYWPHLSTVYDYVYRAMPYGNAQSLSPDETYAVVAYLLYLNDIVTDEDFELNRETFKTVRLPNEGGFVDASGDAPDVPTMADGAPCMSDCKPSVEITMRARILDVTPEDGEISGGVE